MRLYKKLIIACIAVFACAILFCACNALDNIADSVSQLKYSNEELYTVASNGEIKAVPNGLSIDIEWINGSVYIDVDAEADGISFHEVAEGETLKRDTTLHYLLDGDTLRLKYAKSGKFKIGALKKYLYVTVPAEIWLEKIEVETVSGSAFISNTISNEVEIDTVSGSINTACTATRVCLDSVSGDISVAGSVRYCEVETVSGRATVAFGGDMQSIEAESVSGDVYLRPAIECGFKLKFDTVSGVFINAFNEHTVQQGKFFVYGNENRCYIEVDTVSGKLTIEEVA